mmetsp:Transcript_88017/g.172201  ORF Transcript_88017/g.172201 Transcript_88017/m.172201 type:complete len:138 (+) Transcript_88017:142-555(+)
MTVHAVLYDALLTATILTADYQDYQVLLYGKAKLEWTTLFEYTVIGVLSAPLSFEYTRMYLLLLPLQHRPLVSHQVLHRFNPPIRTVVTTPSAVLPFQGVLTLQPQVGVSSNVETGGIRIGGNPNVLTNHLDVKSIG